MVLYVCKSRESVIELIDTEAVFAVAEPQVLLAVKV